MTNHSERHSPDSPAETRSTEGRHRVTNGDGSPAFISCEEFEAYVTDVSWMAKAQEAETRADRAEGALQRFILGVQSDHRIEFGDCSCWMCTFDLRAVEENPTGPEEDQG